MHASRRNFLRALGAMGAGLIVEPLVEPLIVPQRRKIWVVGAQLQAPPLKMRWVWTEYLWPRGGKQLDDLVRQNEHPGGRMAQTQQQALARVPIRGEITILGPDDPNARHIGLGIGPICMIERPVRRAQPLRLTWDKV